LRNEEFGQAISYVMNLGASPNGVKEKEHGENHPEKRKIVIEQRTKG